MHCWYAAELDRAVVVGELLCFSICQCVSFPHPLAEYDPGLNWYRLVATVPSEMAKSPPTGNAGRNHATVTAE